jgi:predicted Zn-dependent protease
LVPLGEPGSVDVDRLAQELAAHYRLPVAVLPDIALPRWTLDANERSLVAEQLILLLRQAYRAQDGAAIIGITDFEMYATEDRTHVFSWRAPPHYGVVSTSSLAANVLDRLRGHSRYERTRKLVARNIGFLYYRRHEVDDPNSLLRPTMHGNGDIDELKESL